MDRVVHYPDSDFSQRRLCGEYGGNITVDPNIVTCRRCQDRYEELCAAHAERQVEEAQLRWSEGRVRR